MKKYFILFLILSTPVITTAQQSKISRGNKDFDKFNYKEVQEIYERVAEKGYESATLYKQLGDSYYLNASYEKAQVWYGRLLEKYSDDVDAETYFRYAVSLKGTKNYKRSDEIMTRFKDLYSKDKRAQLFKEKPDYLKEIDAYKDTYKVTEISVNSGYSDFGPAFYKDKLIFSSAKDTGGFVKRIHKWNGQPFLDLYEVSIDEIGEGGVTYKDLKKFDKSINSPFHESTPTFTKSGDTVYFTRNNYNNGVYRDDINGINRLKIYRAIKEENNKWGKIEELPFSSDDYTIAHPALSKDGKRLYFSSDMPGTFGGADLWYVNILDDGTYSAAVNLGNEINTEGRESYPFISDENNLYFASNGHVGLGGLDIFKTLLGDHGEVSEIVNLGETVNTPKDDFAFVYDNASNKGFFSSNRGNASGNDDIYMLERNPTPPEPPCDIVLKGTVTDKYSGEKISDASVTLSDTNKNIFESSTTTNDATFNFDPTCDKVMVLRAEKEGYKSVEKIVTIPPASAELDELLQLEKIVPPPFEILDILFDFDEDYIRKDAEVELAKVLVYMEKNPTVRIDVRSHTDSRGNDDYNQELSDRRNKSTIKWLVDQGIAPSRLTGRGYGESDPLVKECTNGVPCSEANHQLNRRSEFFILED